MILFLEDWDKYPSAIADTTTNNKSFIRMAALYKHMGIKNHMFMLQLHNPALQGLDPFDPNLTLDQIAMITMECKYNFWYYIREIARAPSVSGGGSHMFRANRGNMAVFWLFFNHITSVLVQIRQSGKSFSIDTLNTYLMNIGCLNTDINLLTKDDDLRSKNIQRLKDIREELPYYLNHSTRGDTNNTEEITVKALGNTFKGHLPNKSPKMALNVGRGLTSPLFHGDEVAFLFNIEISLPAILAAGVAARNEAREKGEPYGTILTTTAGKKDDRDGKFIFNLLCNSAVWSEAFLDCTNLDDLENVIRKNSHKDEMASSKLGSPLRVNCTFNHRQLGYTDEWLKRSIEETMVSGDAADRDFFNVWTSGSLSNPIPLHILERIRASQVNDFYSEIDPLGYITRWYLEPDQIARRMSESHYIMSLDTSEAVGNDDISLLITDIKTGEVVAAGNYNETNLITFCQWIITFFIKYENLTAIIERRSTGGMMLDYLLVMLPAKGIDPFKRLFNRCVNDSDEYRERYLEISVPMSRRNPDVYVKHKKHFGFATSSGGITSRTELYSTTLQSAAKTVGTKIKDITTINQLTSLTTRNGRIDHDEGGHDDMVIAFLLTHWLMTKGRGLSFYGINSQDILIDNIPLSATAVTSCNKYQIMEQRMLRAEMSNLYTVIMNEKDEWIYRKLELKLLQLNSRLVLEEGERFSIDDLISSIRKEKHFNKISKS